MSNAQQPSNDELIRSIYAYAAQEMGKGTPDFAISQALVQRGLEKSVADTVVNNLAEVRSKAKRNAAFRTMGIGGLICIVGLAITIGSMQAGGGRFVVAWGAIIFGGFRFFQGMLQLFD